MKKDAESSPFMLSGTAVMKGTGIMLVTCVGLFSEEGIIQKLITGVGQTEVTTESNFTLYADVIFRALDWSNWTRT